MHRNLRQLLPARDQLGLDPSLRIPRKNVLTTVFTTGPGFTFSIVTNVTVVEKREYLGATDIASIHDPSI
ncbi:hypothetical protein Y032_0911g3006 [Ancylostoma ceylanicum]|uniref:Uncharacterized protein n=1 Tax=Ancylostoma ceylanicum TaxID=53326 RepID=A0A016W9J2_9BILA|nr:hypothetical protein Y032_0911g3006 [Ancylostoma ceylanicum]